MPMLEIDKPTLYACHFLTNHRTVLQTILNKLKQPISRTYFEFTLSLNLDHQNTMILKTSPLFIFPLLSQTMPVYRPSTTNRYRRSECALVNPVSQRSLATWLSMSTQFAAI